MAALTLLALLLVAAANADPQRKKTPPVVPPLLPLKWGTVNPRGWVRQWAVQGSLGAVSPTRSWFASGKGVQRTAAQEKALLDNGTDWPPGVRV